RGITDGMPRR
ncbi:hypothetical protein VN97_g12715, partial [Penicillium thymicola]